VARREEGGQLAFIRKQRPVVRLGTGMRLGFWPERVLVEIISLLSLDLRTTIEQEVQPKPEAVRIRRPLALATKTRAPHCKHQCAASIVGHGGRKKIIVHVIGTFMSLFSCLFVLVTYRMCKEGERRRTKVGGRGPSWELACKGRRKAGHGTETPRHCTCVCARVCVGGGGGERADQRAGRTPGWAWP
jgi:hypothetical protein